MSYVFPIQLIQLIQLPHDFIMMFRHMSYYFVAFVASAHASFDSTLSAGEGPNQHRTLQCQRSEGRQISLRFPVNTSAMCQSMAHSDDSSTTVTTAAHRSPAGHLPVTSGLGDKIDDRGFQAIDAEAAHEAWLKQEAT